MFKNNLILFLATSLGLLFAASGLSQTREHRVDGEVLEDPTQPLSAVENAAQPPIVGTDRPSVTLFTVGFVRASGQSPIAIVNDTQVSVGSVIDGATVIAISARGVELKIGEETRKIAPFASIVSTFE